MARDLFSNQGSTTVSSGGTTAPAQGTTESWTVASSSTFPAASNAASPATQFYISDPALPSETILVTNVSGTTWSVTRGADGTTPVAHTTGFTVRNVVTAAWLTEIEDRYKNTFNVLEYGADATGAADSQPAFQACADAAKAYVTSYGRATMLIPAGKFKLNSAFKLSGGGVTISAYGAYIYAGTAANDLFRDWTTQDSSFTLNGQGLQVFGGIWDMKGHTWAQGVEGSSAFTISNSSNILFRDLNIRNVRSYHGIDMNTCSGITVQNVRVEGFKNSYEWKTRNGAGDPNSVALQVVAATTVAGGNITLSGTQTIDGIAVVATNRVLVKNQTTASENGLWVCAAGAWARAADMPAASTTAANDAAVFVNGGTVNAGTSWYQTVAAVTVGTTGQTWATYYVKQVRAATTTNGTLATAFANASVIDGITLATGDRILLKDQTTTTENGIYTVNASGAPTRATDYDIAAEVNGTSVYISSGTVNSGKSLKQTATVTTVGTQAMVFSTEFRTNRYFSESLQIDNGPNAIACTNITIDGCYMGPAADGSGLGSFGKMAGTHTDSSGQFYTNMKFTNNTSVNSLSNAFQGYSFADSIIANNTILGSEERGIRMYFNSGNSGPRLSISDNVITNTKFHGIEIDGGSSQLFNDVSIVGNTITSTVMNGGVYSTGIHVDTCDRLTVSNNSINLTSSTSCAQGILLEVTTDGQISDNRIYNNGTIGIQTSGCSRLNIVDNIIEGSGDGGIWLTAVTAKCNVSGNLIVGACRLQTTSANGCIVISGNASNHKNSITGNKFQKGTGVEATTPIALQGSSFTDTELANNNYGVDWSATPSYTANMSLNNNSTVRLYGSDSIHQAALGSDFTSITGATTYILVTGLSVAVPAGKYRVKAFLNYSQATAASGVRFGIGGATSAASGPTATLVNYTTTYQTAAAGAATTHASAGYLQNTSTATPGVIATVYSATVDGYVFATASGTISIQGATGATTSAVTVKTGSAFIVEKIG